MSMDGSGAVRMKEAGAAMDSEFHVQCPYCGEELVIYLEPDVQGTLIQDCEVCCNPWKVEVWWDGDDRSVAVSRGDGSE